MISLIRKYQQSLMVLVTIMVIIAFVWFYNGTRFEHMGTDKSYSVYGQAYSQAEIDKRARRFGVAMRVGLNEFVFGLGGGGFDQNQMMESFIWNTFILETECKKLGIQPTDAQVVEAIQKLPYFQANGVFDPFKYQNFIVDQLTPYGFTDRQFEDLIRDNLRFETLKELLSTTVGVSEGAIRASYEKGHQKVSLAAVRFANSDFAKTVEPTEEAINKYFTDNASTLKEDEKRVVSIVKVELSEEEKSLKGKERAAALQKVGDTAGAFSQAILEEGATFEGVAKTMNLTVTTTQEFSQATPAPEFENAPAAASSAFQLTETDPNSDPVRSESGFYVLHLDKLIPSRALTLEEARPKIIEQIKAEQGHNLLVTKATETRTKVLEAVKAGKSFRDAATAEGLKVEDFPKFSQAEPDQTQPDANEVATKAAEMALGDVSEFVPTEAGGIIFAVEKIDPVDEAAFEKAKEQEISNANIRAYYATVQQWLLSRKKDADPKNLQQPRNPS